jgi:uncharacterized phage infection (PIP) family protein YhgE
MSETPNTQDQVAPTTFKAKAAKAFKVLDSGTAQDHQDNHAFDVEEQRKADRAPDYQSPTEAALRSDPRYLAALNKSVVAQHEFTTLLNERMIQDNAIAKSIGTLRDNIAHITAQTNGAYDALAAMHEEIQDTMNTQNQVRDGYNVVREGVTILNDTNNLVNAHLPKETHVALPSPAQYKAETLLTAEKEATKHLTKVVEKQESRYKEGLEVQVAINEQNNKALEEQAAMITKMEQMEARMAKMQENNDATVKSLQAENDAIKGELTTAQEVAKKAFAKAKKA